MDRIEKIETDLMYLTEEVNSLNNTVAELQEQVGKLRKQNELLKCRIDELDHDERPSRKPPHY